MRKRRNYSSAADGASGPITRWNKNRQPKHYVTLGRLVAVDVVMPDGSREKLQFLKAGNQPGMFDRLPVSKQFVIARDDLGKLHILNQSSYAKVESPIKTGNLTGKVGEHLIDEYTALHEDAAPNEFFREPPIHVRDNHAKFGSIEAIEYWKRTKEKSEHVYRHPFELDADKLPELVLSSRSELWIDRQDFITVTERGIEDMSTAPRANASSYRRRRNPVTMASVQRTALGTIPTAVIAVGTIMGMDFLIRKVNEKLVARPGGAPIGDYQRAGLKVGVGILAAVVLDGYIPGKYGPVIASGVGVGGTMGGLMDAVAAYRLRTATVTQPGAYPYLGAPNGMPGYQAQAQQQYAYGQTR